MKRLPILLTGTVLVLFISFAALGQHTAVEIRQALEASEKALGLQTELPAEPIPDYSRYAPPPKPSSRIFGISPFAAKIMFILGASAIIIVVAVNIYRNRNNFSRSVQITAPDDREEYAEAIDARMDKARCEAEAMANKGDYAGAMHILLLQSVDELHLRLNKSIASSLTSREILRSVDISQESRTAFKDIVERVEISYFGDHSPDENDYLSCMQSFRLLKSFLYRDTVSDENLQNRVRFDNRNGLTGEANA